MATAPTSTSLLSAEDFCAWVQRPENAQRWFELVQGEVIEMPPPTRPHGIVCSNITRILGNFAFQQGKGYIDGNDSGVILSRHPDTVRGPDVAYYEDASRLADAHPKYGEVPPRLEIEVLSNNDRFSRITEKVNDYLNNGVELVWLIEPEMRTVLVCRKNQQPQVLKEGEALDGENVLPGFRCVVGDVFRLPGENASSAG